MNDLIESLKGRKTYGLCAMGLGIMGAVSLGWIEIAPELYDQLKSALVFGAIAALRGGMNK